MEEIISMAAALAASMSGGSPYPSPVNGDAHFFGYYYIVEEYDGAGELWYDIPTQMVSDFRAMGREVMLFPVPTQNGFISQYKSKATNSMGRVTGVRPIFSTVDSLAFMVGELEKEADRLSYENSINLDPETGEPFDTSLESEYDIVNAVLAYVRITNTDYMNGYPIQVGMQTRYLFELVCGDYNSGFNSRIASTTRHLFRFPDFFGRLVKQNRYNTINCGVVTDASNIPDNDWLIHIPDPIEPTIELCNYTNNNFVPTVVCPNIDVPHMFAVIDAAYEHTGFTNMLLFNAHLPDIASWAGDLQTAFDEGYFSLTRSINDIQLFKYVMYRGNSPFGVDDFVSDIDGVNIGERYIDYLGKRPSAALVSYYSPKSNFDRFRYDQFPANALRSYPNYMPSLSIWDRFEARAYWDMRLEKNNGNYQDVPFSFFDNPETYIIKDSPSEEAPEREQAARGFLEYIKSRSIFGVGSC